MLRLAILAFLVVLALGADVLPIAGDRGHALAAASEAKSEEEVDESGIPTKRYIEVEPIVLPVLREGKVAWHLTLMIVVELSDPMRVDVIPRTMPQLRDALLTELHSLFAFRYIQDRGTVTPAVKSRLELVAERVLGRDAVQAVLVQNSGRRSLQ